MRHIQQNQGKQFASNSFNNCFFVLSVIIQDKIFSLYMFLIVVPLYCNKEEVMLKGEKERKMRTTKKRDKNKCSLILSKGKTGHIFMEHLETKRGGTNFN